MRLYWCTSDLEVFSKQKLRDVPVCKTEFNMASTSKLVEELLVDLAFPSKLLQALNGNLIV